MDIAQLRAAPVLPDEYFELYEELERQIRELPLIARPHNLASLHAALALEIMAWQLRAIGEREVHVRRLAGLPLTVTAFSHAMHGCHRGYTLLVRAIDNAARPDVLPSQVDARIEDEARAALKAVNGLWDQFTVLNDIAIGWRGIEVNGNRVRAMSRSRERFGRGLRLDIQVEAEQNAPYLTASADSSDSRELHQILWAYAQFVPRDMDFAPGDHVLDLAEAGAHRAGELLTRWVIPADLRVAERFTVGEYRRAAEVITALASICQSFDDYCEPRRPPRLPVRTHAEWVEYIARRGRVAENAADAILRLMTHAASDIRAGGRESPPAAHTPFLDLREGRLALVPTLAIWQDAQLALRTIWKARLPTDCNTKTSELNHQLSEDAGRIFREKTWPTVVRRRIPEAGDVDAGTGLGRFFVLGECKIFIDDPVRGADEREVWRELDRNVVAMRDPAVARGVLQPEGLMPDSIVGLVIVPGRAQSPVDFGENFALLGLDDLRDRAAESASPGELWTSIKAHEVRDVPPVIDTRHEIGTWILESDGVNYQELIRGVVGSG